MTTARLPPLLDGAEAYASALLRESRIRAARDQIKASLARLRLSKARRLAFLALADAADEINGEFASVGFCRHWAGPINIDPETIAELITQLHEQGVINVTTRGWGPREWKLQWLFNAEERHSIENEARRLTQQSISNSLKYNSRPAMPSSFYGST
jgi:hypothetical protein